MYLHQEIIEQIKARYAVYPRPLNGMSNVLVDSFLPKAYIETMQDYSQEFPKTFKSISEFTARITGTQVIDREQLFRMLGYSKKDITALLKAVKVKKLSPLFVGFGGTGSNTLYWLKEMCRITNTVNLFKDLLIVEPDVLSIDNVLRMPMDTMNITGDHRYRTLSEIETYCVLASTLDELSESINSCNRYYSTPEERVISHMVSKGYSWSTSFATIKTLARNNNSKLPYKINLITPEYSILATNKLKKVATRYNPTSAYISGYDYIADRYYHYSAKDYSFCYGAPDIETRQSLKSRNIPLITATHGDDDCSIHLNPEQNTSLQVESYGVIKLGIFFMNQIRMAIGLLELLASDTDLSSTQEYLSYSYLNNDKVLPTDRTYNLQLEHSGLLEA